MRVVIRRRFYEKDCKKLKKNRSKKYTIYELDRSFPFYLLDLNRFNLCFPCAIRFKHITIERWNLGYNIAFCDERGNFATHKNIGFAEEKNATKYFYELLSNIFQKK